jgi:uncharacterized protein (TIGR03083 family)
MTGSVRTEDHRPIARPETAVLASTETARTVALLRSLDASDWARPTDCTEWNVRAVAGHVLGMTESFSSVPRFARTMIGASRAKGTGPFIDAMTDLQVRGNACLTTDELIRRLDTAGPAQARWRASWRLMRAIPIAGDLHDGTVEQWRLAFILDVILTRDTWMHRVDIATATGRPLELTATHDGRIVADVVAEWARRHGRSFHLHLTGPAGGHFTSGTDGEELVLDAVEFCRTLGGRASGQGLLSQDVPF